VDVAEGNVAVVALEKDWAGLIDLVVDFTAGRFGAFDIVVNFHAVESEADFVSDDGGLGSLPLVAGFGDEFVRHFEIVNGAVAVDGICAASIIAKDLDFVAATKIKAAVGFVRNHEVKPNGEVPEFLVGDEVVAVKVFVGGIFENAVFDGPTVAPVWMTKMPARGVFAIEERAEAFFVGSESTES